MTAAARRLTGLAVATLVAAAGLIGLSGASASATSCTTSGITAVVDYNDGAGGGTQSSCDPTSGSANAARVFGDVSVQMQRNPDNSVCTVNGKPADTQCGRLGNQYWSLWWTDGTSGKWVYSQSGVDGLDVPKNGAVAWAWQGASGRRQPAVAAPVVKAAPKPTPTPTPKATKKATHKPTKTRASKAAAALAATASQAAASASAAAATPTASASISPSAASAAPVSATPSASASVAPPTPSTGSSPAAEASADTRLTSADPDTGGLPLWVPAAVVVALGAATGAVLWRRRTTGGRPGA